jgi:hypothetical protein
VTAEEWRQYVTEYRAELEQDFQRIGAMLRAGDTEGLVRYTLPDLEERAAAAARQGR